MAPKEAASLNTVKDLSLGALATRCGEETDRYFRRDSYDQRFCYEIFRRAGEDTNQRAWEIVYEQYHALAHGWILRHPAFPASRTEPQDCLNEAFARLWQALSGEKFARFSDLASILQFLRMCVHSVIIDRARRSRLIEVSDETKFLQSHEGNNPEALLEADMERNALWSYVRSVLKDDQELTIVYENYVLDLKSREKFERHPNLFPRIQDVYRVKQNVLARFRRDEELSKRFNFDD